MLPTSFGRRSATTQRHILRVYSHEPVLLPLRRGRWLPSRLNASCQKSGVQHNLSTSQNISKRLITVCAIRPPGVSNTTSPPSNSPPTKCDENTRSFQRLVATEATNHGIQSRIITVRCAMSCIAPMYGIPAPVSAPILYRGFGFNAVVIQPPREKHANPPQARVATTFS